MELGFNLVFALIVVAAFALWVKMRAGDENSRAKQFALLVCLLALLFPFISITDDLYAAPDIVEGPTISITRVQVSIASKEVPFPSQSSPICSAPAFNVWEHLAVSNPDIPCIADHSASGLRSPPL